MDLDEFFEARQGEFAREATQACLRATDSANAISEDSPLEISQVANEAAGYLALNHPDKAFVYAVALAPIFGYSGRVINVRDRTIDYLIDRLDLEFYQDGSPMPSSASTDALEHRIRVMRSMQYALEEGGEFFGDTFAPTLFELADELSNRQLLVRVALKKFEYALETLALAGGRDFDQVKVERFLSGEEVPHSDFTVIQPGYWEL